MTNYVSSSYIPADALVFRSLQAFFAEPFEKFPRACREIFYISKQRASIKVADASRRRVHRAANGIDFEEDRFERLKNRAGERRFVMLRIFHVRIVSRF